MSSSTIVFARTPAELKKGKSPSTLKEGADAFFVLHANKKSAEYRKWLEPRLRSLITFLSPDLALDRITIWQLDLWYADIASRKVRYADHPYREPVEGGLSPTTLRGYVKAIQVFFNWLGKRRLIVANPASLLEPPPLPDEPPKHASHREVVALLDHFEKRAESAKAYMAVTQRNYVAVRILIATGIRAGGLVGLRRPDVDFGDRLLTVREKGKGGQGKGRTVPLDTSTAKLLQQYMASHDHSYVFPGHAGSSWSTHGLYQVLKRAAKRLEFANVVGPHMLRHYFGFESIRRGLSLRLVQEMMGHASSKTTEIYTKFKPLELRNAYDEVYGGSSDPRLKDF